jgi:GR25 family glycosyltransferase involved in LPS biosynthesis
MIFDKIFYINLDRRTDRDNNIKRLIKEFNLQDKISRVTAVDGSRLDLDKIPSNIVTKKGISDAKNKHQRLYVPLTPGGIGCALSHRSVWQRIVDENLSCALILEDDIHIKKEFHPKINKYINSTKLFDKDFDIIFLGYHPSTIKYIIREPTINDVFVKSWRVYGLFGYVVSKKGAEKLLTLFPINQQIDTEISDAIKKNKLNIYLFKPNHQIITSEPSEIAKEFGTDIQKREISIPNQEHFLFNECVDAFDTYFFQFLWFLTLIVCVFIFGMFTID